MSNYVFSPTGDGKYFNTAMNRAIVYIGKSMIGIGSVQAKVNLLMSSLNPPAIRK